LGERILLQPPERRCPPSPLVNFDKLLTAPITAETFDCDERKALVGMVMGFLPVLPGVMPFFTALSWNQVTYLLVAATGDSSKKANTFAVVLRFLLDRVRVSRVAARTINLTVHFDFQFDYQFDHPF
jgi:hypothetical protein